MREILSTHFGRSAARAALSMMIASVLYFGLEKQFDGDYGELLTNDMVTAICIGFGFTLISIVDLIGTFIGEYILPDKEKVS